MKANEVLKLLRITRGTLTTYCKKGFITYSILPNGRYLYDDESVYNFLNQGTILKTVIYARVSTSKQKNDLSNQIDLLKNFCFQNGWKVSEIYQDVASGISFKDRNDFFKLLDEIISSKVKRVIISYKDRLSRVGFELFYYLFKKFGTEIVVMSEVGSEKLDSQEIFEEIVSLLHCYSMKLYSKRRKKIIEQICNKDSDFL